MTTKSALFIGTLFVLAVAGTAAWTYAGCGACGPAAAPATTAITNTLPFPVHDVTGPATGKKLCYVCRYSGRPSFVVFTRTLDGPFPGAVKAIDTLVQENQAKKLTGFVVLLGANSDANRAKLTALAKEHKLTIPLTIAADGAKGPSNYKLGGDFDTLVLVANQNKVLDTVSLHCHAKACKSSACGSSPCGKTDTIAEAGKKLLDNI
jgi:hypothetical protein